MINKLLIIIFTLIILTNCGYKPIVSSNNLGLTISKININENNNINKIIKKNLKIYSNLDNKSKKIELNINSNKSITTISKDSKGDPINLRMQITVEAKFFLNGQELNKKSYLESFTYPNIENKFNLNKYENTIEKNLVNKITKNIILDLITL